MVDTIEAILEALLKETQCFGRPQANLLQLRIHGDGSEHCDTVVYAEVQTK